MPLTVMTQMLDQRNNSAVYVVVLSEPTNCRVNFLINQKINNVD